MTTSDLWDEATARRHDDACAEMSAPEVLGPTVELLAGLAGGPRVTTSPYRGAHHVARREDAVMTGYVIAPDVGIVALTRLQADVLVTLDARLAESARTLVRVAWVDDLS